MKAIKILYIFLLFICISLSAYAQVNYKKSDVTVTENGKKYFLHKVEKQQSLYAISKLYDADINDVIKDNPSAKEGLKTNQTLKILSKGNANAVVQEKLITKEIKKTTEEKVSTTTKEASDNSKLLTNSNKTIDTSKYFIHVVEAGETLYRIRKMYDLKEKEILEANPEAASGIRGGDELYILKTKNNQKLAKEKETKYNAIIDSYKNTISQKDSSNNDSTNFIPTKEKKEKYRIAIMLPFNLDAIPSSFSLAKEDKSYPVVQGIAIDFFEGVKKAIDSLAKQNIKPEINYFDIDDKDSTKLENLLKQENFKEHDLIIGPMYASSFKRTAEYAKANKIFIISPLTQQNKILYENPYAIKINPSNNTLVEALADYLFNEKKEQDVILISSGNSKDLNMIKSFRQRYLENKRSNDPNYSDSIPVVKGADGVKANYKSKPTALILFTNNQNYLTGYLMGLSGAFGGNNNMTLYGLQSWTGFDNLDPEYLNRLNFTYPTAFYADELNNAKVKTHYNSYFDKHNTSPSEYYYEGFDVVYTLLKELNSKGPEIFTHLEDIKTTGIATKFNFFRPNRKTGYENKSINIIQYSDFQFKKIY